MSATSFRKSLPLLSASVLACLGALSLAPSATAQIDPLYYYRFTNEALPGDSMDIINDMTDDKVRMRQTGPVSGQFWRFQEEPSMPGFYRLSTRFVGPDQVLSCDPGQFAVLEPVGTGVEQLWTLVPHPFLTDAYWLQSALAAPMPMALEARIPQPDMGRLELKAMSPGLFNQAFYLTQLSPVSPATTSQVGSGCDAGSGTLRNVPFNGDAPWIGETMSGRVLNVPSGSLVLALHGIQAVPLSLGLYGSPDCTLDVDPVLTGAVTLQQPLNIWRWNLDVPDQDVLVGVSIYSQCLVFTPGTGFHTTDLLELNFGAR